MRYASFRNSSAVSVLGEREVGGGIDWEEWLVRRMFKAGVRSVMVSVYEAVESSDLVGVDACCQQSDRWHRST